MPWKAIRFIEESVHAPEAMMMSRTATRSVTAPHDPTRTMDCTS